MTTGAIKRLEHTDPRVGLGKDAVMSKSLHLHFMYPDCLHEEHYFVVRNVKSKDLEHVAVGNLYTGEVDGEDEHEYIVEDMWTVSLDVALGAFEQHVVLILPQRWDH